MKKKDTIIIASLVNAALLSLLMLFAFEVDDTTDLPLPLPKPVAVKEVSVKEIVRPEPIAKTPTPLDHGDIVLKTAEESVKPKVIAKEPAAVQQPSEEWYTVKNGDSPWKVAKAHKITTDQILTLNHMSEEKARNLKPGDKIRIR